jgi:hypothetical protein
MELKSLNERLYDDFFVQELDSRLETDPLMTGGLFDLFDPQDPSQSAGCLEECIEYTETCASDCFIRW